MKQATAADIDWRLWRNEDGKLICDLGIMKEAIVIRYYHRDITVPKKYFTFWGISPASYFPFTAEHRDKTFQNRYECMLYAQEIILEWLRSIYQGGFNLESGGHIE